MGLCCRGGSPSSVPHYHVSHVNRNVTTILLQGRSFDLLGVSGHDFLFPPPAVAVRGVEAAGTMAPIFPRSKQLAPRISSHI